MTQRKKHVLLARRNIGDRFLDAWLDMLVVSIVGLLRPFDKVVDLRGQCTACFLPTFVTLDLLVELASTRSSVYTPLVSMACPPFALKV